MAPSFDTLSEQDLHEEEEEIDFSGKSYACGFDGKDTALYIWLFGILSSRVEWCS